MALASVTIRTTIQADNPTDSFTDRSLRAGRVAFSLWATSGMRVPPCPLAGSRATPGGFPRAPSRSVARAPQRLALCRRFDLPTIPTRHPGGAPALLCVTFSAAVHSRPPRTRHRRLPQRASPFDPARRLRGRRHLSRRAAPSLAAADGAASPFWVCIPLTAGHPRSAA